MKPLLINISTNGQEILTQDQSLSQKMYLYWANITGSNIPAVVVVTITINGYNKNIHCKAVDGYISIGYPLLTPSMNYTSNPPLIIDLPNPQAIQSFKIDIHDLNNALVTITSAQLFLYCD